MPAKSFVLSPEQRSAPLQVLGTRVNLLATSAETGAGEVTLQSGSTGMGPPPHSHHWNESFFILKGSVLFTCDGEQYDCGPGTLVHVPAGTIHAFQYGPEGGEMLEFTGEGSEAGHMFKALSEIPEGPPDPDAVTEAASPFGFNLHL